MTETDRPMYYEDDRMVATGVRRLSPGNTAISEGAFSLLHCTLKEEELAYRGVFAVLMFPIRFPDKFVSLWYTDIDPNDKNNVKEREIGIIEELTAFPEEAQRLVRESMAKHYYEQVVTRVHEVKYKHGLLFFEVETRHGQREFVMRWAHDRTEEYGTHGKVLLDSFDNRWVVPDVGALPSADRRTFTSFIYW